MFHRRPGKQHNCHKTVLRVDYLKTDATHHFPEVLADACDMSHITEVWIKDEEDKTDLHE